MKNYSFLLAISLSAAPTFLFGAATKFGSGPGVACYSDSNFQKETSCSAMEGQTLYLRFSSAAEASTYGNFHGTLTAIDSTHAKYTAPAQVLPPHSVSGLQPLPADEIFFTKIDKLPTLSEHYFADGSGYCETKGNLCQGDPTKGTGIWTMVGPPGTAPNNTCVDHGKTVPDRAGSPGDCHVSMSPLAVTAAATSTATILDGTEPLTWNPKPGYGGSGGPLPDVRFRFQENRQDGQFRTPQQNCNVAPGNDAPKPPFPGCAPNGKAPHGTNPGEDMHMFLMDPKTTKTYETYNDLRFGTREECNTDHQPNCTIQSFRQLDWTNYGMPAAMGLAGTPENQLELTPEDLEKAADGLPIQHMLVFTLGAGYMQHGPGIWPAGNGFCYNCTQTDKATLPKLGFRYRLSPTRASIEGGAGALNVTNPGSGYVPGSVLTFPITGCESIDGKHGASGIAFIGEDGKIKNNSMYYAWVTNTGKHCTSPAASLPAPPSGGTQATVTVNGQPKFANANVAKGLFGLFSQYGMQLDDIGANSPEFRIDGTAYRSPYWGTVAQFLGGRGSSFGNPFLYEVVDESSLLPGAKSTASLMPGSDPPSRGWPENMAAASWMADSASPLAGADVPNQAVIKLTAKSKASYLPISLLGVAVGSSIGNQSNRMNIVSGMTPYRIPYWVTGDSKNSGVTWSFAVDPCPGADSLTPAGVYTACPAFNAPQVKYGRVKLSSVANPGAYAYVNLQILPVDKNGNIRIDTGGNGGSDKDGNVWAADSAVQTTGGNSARGDYPGWDPAKWPAPAAQTSNVGEKFLYESWTYDVDITYTLVVPNGNYKVRIMTGQPYNGVGHRETAVPSLDWHGNMALETQGSVKRWSICFPCDTDNKYATPADYFAPAEVKDNVLKVALHGVNWNRWAGWSPFYGGPGPHANGSQQAELSAIAFYKDAAQKPHWEMGSYVPNAFENGDKFTTGLNNGSTNTTAGAIPPGVLQLYVRDWYTGNNDPVWTIASGPGTISRSGLYVAPTDPSAAGQCATVSAQSASQPSTRTSHQVCIAGQH